jgi:hypothetical protein
MAGGHGNRANRPNTWLHRPSLRREDLLANLEPSTHGPKAKSAYVRLHVGCWGMSGTVTSGTNPSLLAAADSRTWRMQSTLPVARCGRTPSDSWGRMLSSVWQGARSDPR